jgi:hypothetical protein
MATPPDYTFGYGVSTKMPQLRCFLFSNVIAGDKDAAATLLCALRRRCWLQRLGGYAAFHNCGGVQRLANKNAKIRTRPLRGNG